nr:M23 family peptidase [uncultured bacterium]
MVTTTGGHGRYVRIDNAGGDTTYYAHLDGFDTAVGRC